MAKKVDGRQKTQSLTIRLDEKSRFMLEFIARETGQSLTTIVERAIAEKADQTRCFVEDQEEYDYTWRHFWHPNEAVRTIRMLDNPAVRTNFEEDELINFVKNYWPFFAEKQNLTALNEDRLNVLWPHMPELMDVWRETKSKAPWTVVFNMRRLLKEADIEAPQWPITLPDSGSIEPFDPDTEIPF